MKTVAQPDRWMEVARNGLTSGARIHASKHTTLEWDIAQKCASPVHREYQARRPIGRLAIYHSRFRRADALWTMELQVRCRRCPPCLKARAWQWRMRAVSEQRQTPGRTWFLTLTCAPQAHFEAYLRASQRLQAAGEAFDRLSPERQFRERVKELNREITLWLKRVRKASGAPLRYLLVAERHKSGLPHFHALVHEASEKPVTARQLRSKWRIGFSQARLVDQSDGTKHAAYVAKYLSKDAAARIRASRSYGDGSGAIRPMVVDFLNENREPPLTHSKLPDEVLKVDYDCSQQSARLPRPSAGVERSRQDGSRLSGNPDGAAASAAVSGERCSRPPDIPRRLRLPAIDRRGRWPSGPWNGG